MVPSGPLSDRRVLGQSGFSLLEILIALFLLVIIVAAVMRTSSTARKVQQSAYYVEQASAFAQGKMDQLSATSLRTVAPGLDTAKTPLGAKFFRSWATIDHGVSKEVVVTVSWVASGRTQAIKLATVVQ